MYSYSIVTCATDLFKNEVFLDWRRFHEGEVLKVPLQLSQVRDLT